MTCGIICPSGSGLMNLLFRILCGFGSWCLCHALSFVIFIIIFAIGYFYWISRSERTKGRWKLYSYFALIIFLLIIFYPSIKALLFTSPFIPPATPIYTCDVCPGHGSPCILSCNSNLLNLNTSTRQQFAIYPSPELLPYTLNITLINDAGSGYDLFTKWDPTFLQCPNSTNSGNSAYDCASFNGGSCDTIMTDANNNRFTVEFNATEGISGLYDLNISCY